MHKPYSYTSMWYLDLGELRFFTHVRYTKLLITNIYSTWKWDTASLGVYVLTYSQTESFSNSQNSTQTTRCIGKSLGVQNYIYYLLLVFLVSY